MLQDNIIVEIAVFHYTGLTLSPLVSELGSLALVLKLKMPSLLLFSILPGGF